MRTPALHAPGISITEENNNNKITTAMVSFRFHRSGCRVRYPPVGDDGYYGPSPNESRKPNDVSGANNEVC